MKIARLKYYAKKPTKKEVPFKVKQGIEPLDRDFLSFIYENKLLKIKGENFSAHHIFAKPAKKTVTAEIVLSCLCLTAIFYFSGKNMPAVNYLGGNVLAAIFGSLIGFVRIEGQKSLADNFNKS